MPLRPMNTAPKDGTEIVIRARGRGMRRVRYVDCAWLREAFELSDGRRLPGVEVTDCWRPWNGQGDDIETNDALGWKPAL